MRTPLLLYVLALVVRAVLVGTYPDPAYPDSYYYADVAKALHAGHGLNVDFVWIFAEVGGSIPANPVLPIPSNAHWLPLSSFLQAASLNVFGDTPVALGIPMILIGALAAPLTWLIAKEAGARREVQLGAGILSAIPAAGTVFMGQPENFAILQPLVAATLWLTARGLKGDGRSYALAGGLVGLASIARNDGFLLGAAVGLIFIADRVGAWRTKRPPRIPFVAAVGCVALYLVVVAPWWIRQIDVFGSISPTATSGRALWIRTMAEWNSITIPATPASFFAQGIGSLVSSRVLGLTAAIANFGVVICSVVLLPLVVIGAWARRRSLDFRPWFLYTFIVFAGAAIIWPVHVPGGAFIHSSIGLGPQAYILALEGVLLMVGWIARRRPAWDVRTAGPLFVAGIVALTVITAPIFGAGIRASWDATRQDRIKLAAEMDRLAIPADDRLLSIDAAGYKYWTGRPGVVTPDDPIATIEAVARAYGARWLVLERNDIAAALGPVLEGKARPPWIGPPAFSIAATDGGAPRLALYPVCTAAGDVRCPAGTARAAP
ncbi:MAG: glycosyltransferase family 39 protein [Chloroflexota bacterium]|nr:glycosyltransferase family 39 protein [Chloroflexota bacterium]